MSGFSCLYSFHYTKHPPTTQVKIDGPLRARYFNGPVTGPYGPVHFYLCKPQPHEGLNKKLSSCICSSGNQRLILLKISSTSIH